MGGERSHHCAIPAPLLLGGGGGGGLSEKRRGVQEEGVGMGKLIFRGTLVV